MISRQKYPFPFGPGLGQKFDPKLLPEGQLLDVINLVQRKLGKFQPRFGVTNLGTDIIGSATNLSNGRALSVYKNELHLFGNEKLYAYSETNMQYIEKGSIPSFVYDQEEIFRNEYQQNQVAYGYNQGISVYAWTDSRGGVRCSVLDEESGSMIQTDVEVSSTADRPKIISIRNNIFIFYRESASIKWKRVTLGSPGTLSAASTMVSDVSTTDRHYDVVVFGNNMVMAYATNASDIDLFFMNSNGAQSPTGLPAAHTISNRAQNCLTLVNFNEQYLFIGWHNAAAGVEVAIRDSLFQAVGTDRVLEALTNDTVRNITGIKTGTSELTWIYEIQDSNTYDTYTRKNTHNTDSTVGTASDFLRSVGLASKSFEYNDNQYVWLSYETTQQPTYFLANLSGNVIGRNLYGRAGGLTDISHLNPVVEKESGVFIFGCRAANRFNLENGVITTPTGVHKTTLNFNHDLAYQSEEVGESEIILGGMLYQFDGVNLVEAGFHHFPENIQVQFDRIAFNVTQQGDGSNPEITEVTCPPGALVGDGEYWNLFSAGDATTYYVYSGSDPSPGGTGIDGTVTDTMTEDEVAEVWRAAIDALSDFSATRSGNVITITNAANGASTDASNGTVHTAVTGSIADGTYQYAVIARWTNARGEEEKSAPSTAVTATLSGFSSNGVNVIIIPTFRLTGKSNVVFDVYKTKDSETVFYRRTSLTSPVYNSKTSDRVVFVDTEDDTDIEANEILYTTGEIENQPIPSAKMIKADKNRVYLVSDEKDRIYFSKYKTFGRGIGFNSLFAKDINPEGGQLLAAFPLDGRIILFKERQIRGFVGSGPNNAGQQDDFSEDEEVSIAHGLKDLKSLVKVPNIGEGTGQLQEGGIMFKSEKGIHLLTRSLNVRYIGHPVEDYNNETITGAVLVPDTNEVRFTTADRCLVFNYFYNQWHTFTNYEAVHCVLHNNQFHFLDSGGQVNRDNPANFVDNGKRIDMSLVTAWYKLGGIQGYQKVYDLYILGEFKSTHVLKIDFYYDYQDSIIDTLTWDPSGAINTEVFGDDSYFGEDDVFGGITDNVYQVRFKMPRQKCQSVKLKISVIHGSEYGEAFQLNHLAFIAGVYRGANRMRSAKYA